MRFYYIRHGQSANNALWDSTGSSLGRSHDPELTDLGRAQAACLARVLSATPEPSNNNHDDPQNRHGFGLTHLYTSLTLRAVATSSIVAEAVGLPAVGWPDWHESGGLYVTNEQTGEHVGQPGPGRSFFQKHYPRLILPDTLGDEGWYFGRPFEDRPERPLRAQRVLQGLLERHGQTDDRVAVVAHGGFYNYVLAALLGVPRLECHFVLNNACITRVDFGADGVRLVYQNRSDHLPRNLIT
jgi:2,3-bisphosphoglycerate-dependent phosphoglycerate mutase